MSKTNRHSYLRNADEFMRLKAQPPVRMRQTVRDGGLGVARAVRPVHRLKPELIERKPLEFLGIEPFLRINKFELMPFFLAQFSTRFRTDANPVQPSGYLQRSICFDRR